ncbi:FliH/SctL family protein [Oceanobacter mangrovi]|uniref:FliH/SctL family protein n=1 Tax=Oceanobacter mangrovi TaxID=2862510 RepID=UPI001C8DC90F|nr:FliH/SctL family protein [Oceanobacter mangrovi]
MADKEKTKEPLLEKGGGSQARPWKLPFWTEDVVHKVERDSTALALSERSVARMAAAAAAVVAKSAQKAAPEPQRQPQQVPAKLAEKVAEKVAEEITEAVQLPTAEELETIRREAYNEGLEQGLVEGRQTGEKKGYQEGLAKGKTEGLQQGEKEGRSKGFAAGEAEAKEAVQTQVKELADRFAGLQRLARKSLLERDAELPEMLAALVVGACEQVLKYELADGARGVYQYVREALQQLPEGSEADAKVYVAADDASHLEGQLADFGEQLEFAIDKNLKAGECQVKTADSRVDYRVQEHLQTLLTQLAPALRQNVPDEAELEQQLDADIEQAFEEHLQAEHLQAEQEAAEQQAAELAAESSPQAPEQTQTEVASDDSLDDIADEPADTSLDESLSDLETTSKPQPDSADPATRADDDETV